MVRMAMYGGRAGLLCFPLAFLVASGCVRSLGTRGLMMQRSASAQQLYREPSFGREDLEREGLTCLSARLSFGHETYGYALVQGLVEVLQESPFGKGMVHPNKASSLVNEAGLAEDYAAMIEAYDKTHILYRDTLRKIGQAVGVRYFAIPILVRFDEGRKGRISFFGLRAVETAWATARFQLQIWDAQSGWMVWEGLVDLTLAQERIRERPISFEDMIRLTWEALIEKIPSDSALPSQEAKEPA